MKVIIASDCKSVEFKNSIKNHLINQGHQVVDKTDNKYVNFVEAANYVADAILSNEGDRGIVIDEYGTGSFNIATKHKGIICAQVSDEHSAKMTTQAEDIKLELTC